MPSTPFEYPGSRHRFAIDLDDADRSHIGRGKWGPVEVTDQKSGARLLVRSAACGAACHCAAEVVHIVAQGHSLIERYD